MAFLKDQQHRISDNIIFYLLLLFSFCLLLFVLIHSAGTYDGGDGVSHYFISRFSFQHPKLFLDLWGKPLFTMASSPFAQFGLKGITLFNILCGILSAWCGFEIAKKLEMKFPWVIFCFSLFSPIYFGVLNSGLTEPFFSLMLIFSILLLFKNRTYMAAIIFSLAPFVRPEANYMILIFILYFIMRKQYKAIPLLFTGTVLFSLIGALYFHDILWLKTNNPYNDANAASYENIENGELFHYLKNYLHITGWPIALLIVIGSLYFLVRIILRFRNNREKAPQDLFTEELILLYFCFFFYVAAHSVIWWKRIFPTLGMFRYMSPILPVAALICLRGLNFVFDLIRNKLIQLVILIPFLVITIRVPFQEYYYPFELDGEQRVVQDCADWLVRSGYKNSFFYPLHPFATLALDIDPFDAKSHGNWTEVRSDDPGKNVTSGSIIIWDAHYGANDCHLPLDSLLNSRDYTVLQSFKPKVEFKVLGDVPYSVYLFMRK